MRRLFAMLVCSCAALVLAAGSARAQEEPEGTDASCQKCKSTFTGGTVYNSCKNALAVESGWTSCTSPEHHEDPCTESNVSCPGAGDLLADGSATSRTAESLLFDRMSGSRYRLLLLDADRSVVTSACNGSVLTRTYTVRYTMRLRASVAEISL